MRFATLSHYSLRVSQYSLDTKYMHSITYPELPATCGFIATTGFFDGVHLGHKAVLQQVTDTAHKLNKPSCVITFWPHPRIVLQKDADKLHLLSTLEDKQKLIEQLGVDYFLVIPFTQQLSTLSAKQFFNNILVRELGISQLIIGYDHHFGQGGFANFDQIIQYGNEAGVLVAQVQANQMDGVFVSSSKIRDALQLGHIDEANTWLGYTYSISGEVVHGKKLGRQLGFPTANIQPTEPLKLLPHDGIYAVKVIVDGDKTEYKGMLSIGFRPTVDNSHKRTIEVNIFDFDSDLYGQNITVQFVQRLRNEWKFDTLSDLRHQLIQDKKDSLNVLGE